ncbi:hypothetical protein GGG16DRAFT_108979 [Schizophyllum commune]
MQLLAEGVQLLSPRVDAQSLVPSAHAHLLARSGDARLLSHLVQPLLFAHHDWPLLAFLSAHAHQPPEPSYTRLGPSSPTAQPEFSRAMVQAGFSPPSAEFWEVMVQSGFLRPSAEVELSQAMDSSLATAKAEFSHASSARARQKGASREKALARVSWAARTGPRLQLNEGMLSRRTVDGLLWKPGVVGR